MADPRSAAIQAMLSNTYTIADAYKRLLLLEDFLQHSLFGNAAESGKSATQLLKARYLGGKEHEIAEAVALWGDSTVAYFTADNVHTEMEALKAAFGSLPALTLYAPVYFDQPQIREIGEWCRANIDKRLMIDLRVDPKAAGGCVFVWKNKLHDFSLGYFMRKHSNEFDGIVRSFLVATH